MSVFKNILGKIFGRANAATPAAASGTESAPAPEAATTSGASQAGATPELTAQQAAPAQQAQTQPVDVEAILNDLAAKNPQKLNWRTSIVDLLKLLDMDSSLAERKELARELNYTGDTNDSAAMNIWLHKEVMRKLAENGGKVPDELRN